MASCAPVRFLADSCAAICAAACLAAAPAAADELSGTWRLASGGATLELVLERSASGEVRGTLASSTGTTLTLVGTVEEEIAHGTCTGAGASSMFEAEVEGKVLVLTLLEVGPAGVQGGRSLEFTRAAGGARRGGQAPRAPAAEPAPEARSRAQAVPGAGDGDLRAYFAGEYYSYTRGSTLGGGSGTERTVTLCPDGRYRDSFETSASGAGWGQVGQGGGAGRWRMQGTRDRGTLLITHGDGRVTEVPYQADRREQTLRLGGTTFAFSGAARCP